MVQSRDDYDNDDDEPVIFLSSRGDKSKALHYRMQRSNKMHTCIKEKKWQEVINLLHYRETDSRIWIEENNEDGSRRWKSLPIHLVSLYTYYYIHTFECCIHATLSGIVRGYVVYSLSLFRHPPIIYINSKYR